MKTKTKALACLLFAVILTIQFCPSPAITAPSGLHMISVNDDLLKPEQNTIPFWENGTLYIPHTVFKGIYRESLGVSYASTVDGSTAYLFNQSRALTFNLETGTITDDNQNQFSGSAIIQNGTVFFPINHVADFFGLSYTYTQTEIAPLIRIKNEKVVLSDARFIDAAKNLMQNYYKEYEITINKPAGSRPAEPTTIVTGQWIYPVFTVTDSGAAVQIVDTLSRWNMQATFLLTAEQIEKESDLLRKMVGTKQAVAIVVEGETAEDTAEQISRGSEALWAAAHSSTRFVWLAGDSEDNRKTAESMGFCAVHCALDNSSQSLTSTVRVDALYNRISSLTSQHITVYMGNDIDNTTTALRQFLSKLEAGDCRVLAWRETL